MQDISNLEEYFLNEIKRQSDVEVEQLKKQQDEIRTKAIDEIRLEIQREVQTNLEQDLKEMASEYTVKNSKVKEEKNRKLMLKREELTNQIFDEVTLKLRTFMKTDEYQKYLQRQVDNLHVNDVEVTFYISKQDENVMKEVFKNYKKATVVVDKHIQIGGFRMENEQKGIVVDETFDARLQDEKTWFYANSSLAIR